MSVEKKTPSRMVTAIAAVLIGLVAGFSSCYFYFQPRMESMDIVLSTTLEDLSTAEGRITQLQSELMDISVEKSKLENLLSNTNATLSKTLEELLAKKMELERSLEELNSVKTKLTLINETATLKDRQIAAMNETISLMRDRIARIGKAILKLDNDRKLLIYLRMEMPETRENARAYWQNVKNVSVISDARLGPLVDEVTFYIDSYFDWLDKEPGPEATREELANWLLEYYLSPAIDYALAIDKFTKEAYLTIITHIEVVTELAS